MSYAEIGAPVGTSRSDSPNARVFHHIPKLHELVTSPPGGWPGIVYAQVCVHNMKRAADRTDRPANLRPIQGYDFFTIRGPTGDVSMAIMGTGTRIRAASPLGGARLFFTDGEVQALTGLAVEGTPGVDPIWFGPKPQEPSNEQPVTQRRETRDQPQRTQGQKGHGRVEGGEPA